MVIDLDEQIFRCRPGASKSYAEEALAAYRVGAYRSSIVTTWIAVVFNIIEKMREAALFGNKEVKEKLAEFDQWQEQIAAGNKAVLPRALGFERDILDYAHNKLEFIDGQQLLDLNRLQEDRNRCAHPTLQRDGVPYQPTGEVARAHLCHAMLHLLQQPPVQGRAALAELRRIVSSIYFPKDTALAKTALSEHVLARPSPALIRGAIDELLFGFFQEGDSYCHKPTTTFALRAIIEIARNVAEPRLKEQFSKIATRIEDKELLYEILLVMLIPECDSVVSDAQIEKLNLFIKQAPIANLIPVLNRGVSLRSRFQTALITRIASQPYEEMVALVKAGIQQPLVERAVTLYSTSGNWIYANNVSQSLIIPLITHLKREHVERIVNSAGTGQSDLAGSHGFKVFIRTVRSEKVIEADELEAMLRAHPNLENYLAEAQQIPVPIDDDIPF
jgi:hypothetical protein